MASLEAASYYLDDWDKIEDGYTKYLTLHEQHINILQQWLSKQPHLPKVSRRSLGIILTFSDGSTEAAKETLENYYTHRSRNPELFTNRFPDLKRVEQTLDLVEIGVPDPWERTLKGARLTYVRLIDTDADKLDFHMAMQVFTAALDYELARMSCVITGIAAIFDMTGFHLGFLAKLNITDIAATLRYSQILEKRVASIHIINCNHVITQLMALLRPFLSKELTNKINFYSPDQMQEFYKKVPKDCVPTTYGGYYESMPAMNEKFRKRFRVAEDWLKLNDSQEFRVKEHLRPVTFGAEEMKGSFRKLCID